MRIWRYVIEPLGRMLVDLAMSTLDYLSKLLYPRWRIQ